MSETSSHHISTILVHWYHQNKRELPWRETTDPYLIWISEIILQQTRVAQGLDYYLRFVRRFPDVKSLADADEGEVLSYWQGLGYYSRARNLHCAARTIMTDFNGRFPQNYKDILALKGIGEYTAAAIISFAYNQPYSVVDGNVFRLLSRLFAIEEPIDTGRGKKFFSELAQELLDKKNPGIHNQAIMEFGALQCTPSNPNCLFCPLQSHCLAYEKGIVNDVPRKQGKTNVLNRYFNYFDIRFDGKMLLKKRNGNDIWRNLYEFPLIETSEDKLLEEVLKSNGFAQLFPQNQQIELQNTVLEFKHVLSHRIIYAKFYSGTFLSYPQISSEYKFIRAEELPDYAISRLLSRYLEKR